MKHILIAVVFLLVFGCGLQNQVPQDQTTNTDTDKNSKKDPNDAINVYHFKKLVWIAGQERRTVAFFKYNFGF